MDVEKNLYIKYIDLNYFLFMTNITKKNLHNIFHILIDIDVVEKRYFSICPRCLNESKISGSQEIIKCSRCKKYFDEENIIEKFAIKGKIEL